MMDSEVRLGDKVIDKAVEFVRKSADGQDDPWLRGFALGKIHVALCYLDASSAHADAATAEIQRLTRPAKEAARSSDGTVCG